jgi:hypothetical protein
MKSIEAALFARRLSSVATGRGSCCVGNVMNSRNCAVERQPTFVAGLDSLSTVDSATSRWNVLL